MKSKEYNEKGFLLPESANSMACYHAKITEDGGQYKFSIHDCNGGIRLHGELNEPEEVREAVDKLNRLSLALAKMARFIYNNYLIEDRL